MIKDGHRISECFSRKINSKEMTTRKKTTKREVTLDGLLTVGMLETGLHAVDFMCCEDVTAEIESFVGLFKVQFMRDGNLYLVEKPKRVRNKALFRDDNCSLTKGRDGRWYFNFSLDGDQLEQLPHKLVHQASAIAQKVICLIHNA